MFQRRYVAATDDWGDQEALLDDAGNPVRMAATGSPAAIMAPAIANTATPSVAIPIMTLAFAAPGNNCLQLWDRSLVTGRFNRNVMALWGCTTDTHQLQSIGRPALAWVPDPQDRTLQGRLHLVYRSRTGADVNHHQVKQMTSVGWPTPKLAIQSSYDNNWTYAYGLDLLYERGVDTNLRAVMAATDAPKEVAARRRLRFDPVADGITAYAYDDSDDWRVMRHSLCAPIAAEQPSATRVTCPRVAE